MVAQKMGQFLLNPLTLSNINRFSKLFHCPNRQKIGNNIITKEPTTPQVCRYTTLWNVSVLKATIENKTTSVTTHFKKATAGNMLIVLVIVQSNCHIVQFYIKCSMCSPCCWTTHSSHLLKGTPNSVKYVPSSVWRCAVLLQGPGVALASCRDVR